MCTLSWWRPTPDSYQLYFNRDEKNSRLPELPPSIAQAGDVPYLAPTDANAGGTWIALNAYGLTTCLLNDYQSPTPPSAHQSRGQFVRHCAAAPDIEYIHQLLQQPLHTYPPFHLITLSPQAPAYHAHWNGQQLTTNPQAENSQPHSSSSYQPQQVVPWRQQLWRDWQQNHHPNPHHLHQKYHQHYDPQHPHKSILMCRPDAHTKSHCHITVTPQSQTLDYALHDLQQHQWQPSQSYHL